ncbi:ketoacyl-ACP synthase III [Geomonas sp. Red421]|uniref:Beta-ketoacyl-[acyl-carrier-protein] synthase III n=1 Tax=Geomonas anaerohicana TaxID=2798583 RepID=A0ABS0YED0_9BACT|nr:ketoacyl-ACP synthase III [Geomonas anaerohicana]
MRPRITGTGSAVPEKVLTNFDLEKMVDTTDEWIVTRTGIRERRIAAEGEYTSTFAIAAAERALAAAGVKAEEIDMIVVGTLTPDFPFPATACIVQQALKATNAFCFDLSAACSGFIYALSTAQKFIVSGQVKKALVIGAEVLSRIVDWNDRNTCLLFGDGAGAVVLEAQEGESGILSTHMHSDGNYWEILYQKGAGSRNPASHKNVDEGLVYLTMQGNEVFKLAVRSMGEVAMEALEANGLTAADVNLFIPHQANQRIVDSVGKRLGITGDRVFVNLDRYGNTSAASIPIALDEAVRAGRLKEGDLLLLDAFGGGLTWGSALVRW